MTFAMLALIASWIGTTLPSSDSPTRCRSGLLGNGMTGTTPSGFGSGHGSPGTIRRSQAVPPTGRELGAGGARPLRAASGTCRRASGRNRVGEQRARLVVVGPALERGPAHPGLGVDRDDDLGAVLDPDPRRPVLVGPQARG